MVTKKYEKCVVKIVAGTCHFHIFANVVIQQANGVVLGIAAETIGGQLVFGDITALKIPIVGGNRKRAMVAGGLDKCKKRLI